MARKEPFKRISVADRIYEAVDKRRREDYSKEFRPLAMNAYCEKILWDFARGELILKSQLDRRQTTIPVFRGEDEEWIDRVAEATPDPHKKAARRQKK